MDDAANRIAQLEAEVRALRQERADWESRLFAADFVPSHKITAARELRTVSSPEMPAVLVAILAKQKEKSLPFYLECIERLDYPKSSMFIYIRTNNNKDRTESILREWVGRVGHLYRGVEFDAADVETPVQNFRVHEWNPTRLRVLAHIRNVSLRKTSEHDCKYYFVCDVDNFIVPWALKELVQLRLPNCCDFHQGFF